MASSGKGRPRDALGPRQSAAPFNKQGRKGSKRHEEASSRPSSSSSLVLAQDDEPDFPRGGRSLLTREEEAEARAEADEEFEREMKWGGKNKKGKKTNNKDKGLGSRLEAEDEWASLFGGGITGKLPRYANRVTLKNISPNMKLWGVIAEVNTKDLVVSLPGGLRGFVRAEEALDISPDDKHKDLENNFLCCIFHIGQLVPCIVLQVDEDKREGKPNKRIWLSLRLSSLQKGLSLDVLQVGMVLTAQVKSIEDHGYILHFGLSSVSGFLPESSQDDAKMLKTGQLLQGAVKSIDKARRVVILNSDPELVTKCVVQELKGLSIDLLIPGMMVTAQVHATLENGIMLSFLTYLTGTVDIFHLQDSLPNASWKDEYTRKKVNARILFVDPSTRAVGLTLNPHLVRNIAPPRYAKTGDIYEGAKIVRVDKGIGLLLEIPSTPESSPVYVNMFDIDDEIQKLEKKFKEGMHVRVRILGMRHLEGLAMGTLKASALEGSVFTHSDVKPGMLVKAKVIAVESFGAIVQFSSGVKALCPLPHMSEFEIVKPSKKFKIGAELLFRVLGCKSKRITVTHKKTLVKSKLQVLASYTDATEGLITHGWITKIEDHGCFVRFYNGVQGFAHRSELGLEPGSAANTVYHVGQVVKCRIISSSLVSRRINISFVLSRKRDAHDSMIKPGSIVSAVVERLTPGAVIVHVKPDGYMKGTIYNEHLADHQGHASLMKSLLRPGYEFVELLVLDADGDNLILSAKYSLINSSHELPLDISHICDSSVVHGYICNVIGGGCFVRFLGKLTGFCPQNKVSDNHVDNLSDAYYIGQSVRGYIVAVNSEADRITLSLKQSSCFSTNSSFMQSYFLTESRIAELQIKDTLNSSLTWQEDFSIGSFVEGEVQEMKDYGVVVGFKGHKDVIGFASQYQLGGRGVEIGSHVKTLVLDVSLMDGLVDLSLKEEFVSKADEQGARNLKSKKKRRRESYMGLQLHQTVNAIVEIVKENYLVLSVPEYNYAIGYASVIDYNTQKIRHTHFINGQSVVATVAALPNPSTVGRLLLLLKSMSDVSELSSRRAKKRSSYAVGSLVDAEITEIKPLEVCMKFGVGCHGRVHITEVFDDCVSVEEPFSSLRIGQVITVRVIAKAAHSGKTGKGCQWELSLKPSKVSGLGEACDPRTADKPKFLVGDSVRGYVVKVDKEWLWLTVSRDIMAKIFILDTSCEPNELQEFEKHYQVGQAVSGYVLSINEEKKLMRLLPIQSLVTFATPHTSNAYVENQENTLSNIKVTEHLHEGDIVGGRIKTVLPGVGGLLVQIGPHLYGRVHYTELTDQWLTDPLFGYEEGQFVKCKVLEISRSLLSVHVDLSLRASITSFGPSIPEAHHNMDSLHKRLADVEELQPRMVVKGYVKSVTSKGCFIMLSRKIDARILISNLSDGFIEDPEAEFQVGKLVEGRVLSVDTSFKKVDLTLRSEDGTRTLKPSLADLQQLHVGDIISGKIKQIESYGLFITIDHSNIVGLCHKSELAGDHVENFETKYTIGDRVSAKILKVDVERQRISLSMKDIHGEDGSDVPTVSDEEVVGSQTSIDDSLLIVQRKEGATSIDEAYVKMSSGNYPNLAQAESRASVPPLEVVLDDTADSDVDDGPTVSKEVITEQSVVAKKNNRQLKRKELEDRELEISASEERRLQNDIPRTEDEFEKLVRSSPNSSFVWIKYMAFMLSLADVEKARSIAERALKTINIREEDEKLNIWVAYFNLENEYGSPPEEAVKKTFERALQYCDPKRLHLALLGMYERTEQYKLADELLEKMVKKFKHSCKVWLRHLQSFLKQRKDGVQTVVNRALLCLPRKKHIKFISQAALQEFKCGEPDRGRSMLEGVLREYPKRTDLWSVYLDQEIRLGDVEVTRALFERATCLSLPPKKMKALGYVHGARIIHAPEPVHGRLSEIEHAGCDLFLDIPTGSKSGFKVVRYHSLIVDEDTLPEELVPIAWTTSEQAHSFLETETSAMMSAFLSNSIKQSLSVDSSAKNVESSNMGREKVLMGIMHSTRPHYGVQFHPESIATSHGRKLFKNFKKMTIDYGLRSSALHDRKVAFANQISRRFKVAKVSVANLLMGQHIVSSGIPIIKDSKHLKLQWRKFNGMAKQVGGTGNIFVKLFGDQNAEDTFWLDSSSTEQRRARFSFMGSKGGPLWKQMTFWLSDQSNKAAKGGGYLSTRNANGEKKTIFLNDGFLDFLDKELQSFQYDKEDYQALPFDFCGGFVGYIGYGLKVECGASSNRHKSMVPDACFFFADNLLVIDHSNDDVYILSIHDTHCRRSRAAQHDTSEMKTWLDETEKKLLGLVSSPEKMFIKHKLSTCPSNLSKPKFVVEKSRCQYMKDVESCLKFIQDGESYELCLTTQMKMRVKDIDAFGTYCTLRERNPAPYAAWLNFSKENLSILCSSPERFLQLDRNGILEAKPIKGTIARGATMEEDDHLKFQLQHSEKDQAENLMIVDLLRNDLGRVCEPGTVHVPHLMKVESYATVHTMVSTIRGEKIADLSPMDCVRAAFPGGSMTGAPKLRSMELLDTIECCSRGVYSGSIGFFSYNQRFDLNIVIRTVVIHEGEASIGAGGAVVALSSPEDEYEEMLLKARAPARVVEEYSKEVVSEKSLTSSSFHSGLCEREPLPLD